MQLKKFKKPKTQAWPGFEPDLWDSDAVLYQLSYLANWDLVTLWVCNIPLDGIGVLVNSFATV